MLPVRHGRSTDRQSLYRRALAVPPETLLTLASLHEIRVAVDAEDGEGTLWRSTEKRQLGDRTELEHAPSGNFDRFPNADFGAWIGWAQVAGVVDAA